MVERLCASHDLVPLQESRGKAANMLTLLGGFVWRGSFFRADAINATSRAGAVVVGIRDSVPGARTAVVSEVSRGRCIAIRLHSERRSMAVVNVHLDPSLSPGGKLTFLRSVCEFVDSDAPVPTIVGGDWNFLASGERRLDVEHGERGDRTGTGAAFDAMFGDLAECAQEQHMFSRVYRQGESAAAA